MRFTLRTATTVAFICSLVVSALSDESLPEVPGIIGMQIVEEGSCIAVFVPMNTGDALSGFLWYNNDGLIVYPEILVASGLASGPEPASAAYPVASDVVGQSSAWSTVTFSEPIASAEEGFYVVFRLPLGSEHVATGAGGGAGIGYTVGANGFTGWLSNDGDEWVMLDEGFGVALTPTIIPAEEGMVEKALSRDGETPVTHTAMMLPAPNPFNPQTELKFQLKEGCEVDLSIYNVRGERVVKLVDGAYPSGHHSVFWRGVDGTGRRMPSGAYFARFSAGGVVQTHRLLLVK